MCTQFWLHAHRKAHEAKSKMQHYTCCSNVAGGFCQETRTLAQRRGGKQNQSKEQRLLVGLQTLLQVMDEDPEDDSAENDGEIK